jgi:hypothetical protein
MPGSDSTGRSQCALNELTRVRGIAIPPTGEGQPLNISDLGRISIEAVVAHAAVLVELNRQLA